MKILSIIIPVYNTELFLARCLDSLSYNEDVIKDLDVIIVNDGSTDDSAKIAKKYCIKYPKSFRLINKKNGGHGSTINTGLKEATGKYVKVLDSDDWINIIDFPQLVQKLKNETSDIVVTNYKQEIVAENQESFLKFNTQGYDKKMNIEAAEQLLDMGNLLFFQFSLASMTIKRDVLLANWGEGLFEKSFFVDQQFVAKVLANAQTYIVYDLDIYRYFIGRWGQSSDSKGFFKHRNDHTRVLKWLLSTLNQDNLSDIYKKILTKQILSMLNIRYNLYISHPKLNKTLKQEILEFDSFIKNNYPELHHQILHANKIHRRLSPILRNKFVFTLYTLCKANIKQLKRTQND